MKTPLSHPREPLRLIIPAAIGAGFLLLPLLALLVRTPWASLSTLITEGPATEALWLSLRTAGMATILSLFMGVPLAWLIARSRLPWMNALRTLVTLPMVLPPVVGGVALLSLLGRRGLLGQYLDAWFGITIPFSTVAVVLAQAFVATPFLVLAVEGHWRSHNHRLEDIASTLGAQRWYAFRTITLPTALPAIGAGAALAFARSLGEFGATITFAGNFPGTTRTMPIAIYLAMESDPDLAIALSFMLMALCVAVLLLLRSHWVSNLGAK